MEVRKKRTGITQGCWKCGHTVLTAGNFLGIGSFVIFCSECKAENKIDITQKTFAKVSTTILVIILIGITIGFTLGSSQILTALTQQ